MTLILLMGIIFSYPITGTIPWWAGIGFIVTLLLDVIIGLATSE